MEETLFESADGHVRITGHAQPPAGFVELLAGVVWGTGAVRYTIRDMAACVAGFGGSRFVALREDGALAGTYVLAPRVLHVAGHAVPAVYRTLLALAPGRARRGLGELLSREVRSWLLARAQGPFATYGFVEAENVASLTAARRAGHGCWGTFVAAPVTRLQARDHRDVEELPPDAPVPTIGEDDQQITFQAGAGAAAARFVVREGGQVVAEASALEHRWALHGLGGTSGFLAHAVLPKIPGLRRLLDPDDLRFAFFASSRAARGHEAALARLFEAVLARWRLHAGLAYLDPRGRSYQALRRAGLLGLVHALGVRPPVNVMGSAVGLPAEADAALRARPFAPSIADHV